MDPTRLKVTNLLFDADGKAIVQMNGQYWACDLGNYNCTLLEKPVPDSLDAVRRTGFRPYSRWEHHYVKGDSISPNKQWISFVFLGAGLLFVIIGNVYINNDCLKFGSLFLTVFYQ